MQRFVISYSRNDIAIAQNVSKTVEQHGLKSFADFNFQTSDLNLTNQVVSIIKECNVIFFIVSKSSLNSQWCRREIEYAIHEGK